MSTPVDPLVVGLTSGLAEALNRSDELEREIRRVARLVAEIEHGQRNIRATLNLLSSEIDGMAGLTPKEGTT